MNEAERRTEIQRIFTSHEIDEVSISSLPDIINEIMSVLDDVRHEGYTDGYNQGQIDERYVHFG